LVVLLHSFLPWYIHSHQFGFIDQLHDSVLQEEDGKHRGESTTLPFPVIGWFFSGCSFIHFGDGFFSRGKF
jgi:hypothetical protein